MAYCVFCGSAEVESFCTACGKQQPNTKTRKPRRKISPKALIASLVVAGLLGVGVQQAVVRLVLPYQGPLSVELSNDSVIRDVSGVIYTVSVNGNRQTIPVSGADNQQTMEWESDNPIQISVTSKLVGERDLTLQLDPRTQGTFGLEPNTEIRVKVRFTDEAITANLLIADENADGGWRPFGSDKTTRIALDLLVQECVSESASKSKDAVEFAKSAYQNYLDSVEKARLDGERSLTYTEWETRARRLVGYLDDEIASAPSSTSEVGQNFWFELLADYREARDAWANLQYVSATEDDNRWDSAWDRIWDADYALDASARKYAASSNLTYETCLATLYK